MKPSKSGTIKPQSEEAAIQCASSVEEMMQQPCSSGRTAPLGSRIRGVVPSCMQGLLQSNPFHLCWRSCQVFAVEI